MRATKRSRSVNKRYSSVNEVSSIKDSESTRRNNQPKRKWSDMLGPQWSKEELSHFYEAYRKYNLNWKKIAAAVRNRSVEMVEALYTMNRAYLSLPEGTASVAGLIAMMTDYYSNLARSDSEQESNDGVGTSRKPRKRARVKSQPSNPKAFDGHFLSSSPTAQSGYGFQSLLKKKRSGGSRPRAVGKRTPRFPVGYSFADFKGEKLFSATRQGARLEAATDDNYDVTREIALALTEASQRGGSPQVSQTPSRRTESVMSSPARNAGTKKLASAKLVDSDVDEEELEGSMEADTGELTRSKTYLEQTTRAVTRIKGRRSYGKKLYIDDTGDNNLVDTREACSETEGQRFGAVRHEDARISKSSPQGPRKKSKKVLFKKDDDEHDFDALQTLADISLMMPAEANEEESKVQMKDEHDDHEDESGSLVAMAAAHQRDKRRSLEHKIKGDEFAKHMLSSKPKPGKASLTDINIVSEVKREVYSSKPARKKPKIATSKIRKSEVHLSGHVIETQEAETVDTSKMTKDKRSPSVSPKLTKNAEHSSGTDLRREGSDSAQSTMQAPLANKSTSQTRVRSRRKSKPKKPDVQKDMKYPEKTLNDKSMVPLATPNDTAFNLKRKLSNCLSNQRLRRWCTYEWFYNAIDYPWFAKREIVEYLYHVGLGHVPRLSRVEWGVIRSSLGKPRRFSQQFLKEEKEKLNMYRDSVRAHYTELREGVREGLPTDLARPLSVGQRVMAVHPRSREIHDGSVLTVDHSRCRVQFDRPDLGVEFVTDIDCMPLNPMENLPTLLARQIDVDKFFENFNELRMNEQAKVPTDNLENVNGLSHLSTSTIHLTNHLKLIKAAPEDANLQTRVGTRETPTYQPIAYTQPCTSVQAQAKEADVQALAKLKRSLDKKEALVSELKRMNDDVVDNCSLKESESFKKQYAAVLVQLHDANEQVSSALICLRQRNAYPITLAWPRPMGDPGAMLNSLDRSLCQSPESGSHANEIIESSRKKARTMVDVALQAMPSLKCRENTFEKIEAAIDYVNSQLPSDDSTISAVPDDDAKSSTSDGNEACIPAELITQCVATLLMIQKCTERQFPPGDVAQILDSAVTSLKPCSPQNLAVYGEIQKCMGIIKNQILALIPT